MKKSFWSGIFGKIKDVLDCLNDAGDVVLKAEDVQNKVQQVQQQFQQVQQQAQQPTTTTPVRNLSSRGVEFG